MTAHERLKKQVEDQEKSIKTIIEMLRSKGFPNDPAKTRLDDIEEKINKITSAFFEELYELGVDPVKSKSRIDLIEDDFEVAYDRRLNIFEKKLSAYMDRSWWRKVLGIGPRKENIKLAVGPRK
ncbi:hypothetical protein KAR91_45785 [Candidatus Pacearchaeota archaeon]|nr:hypothetical protein [Candidatus Pacearchaeota archaeon]